MTEKKQKRVKAITAEVLKGFENGISKALTASFCDTVTEKCKAAGFDSIDEVAAMVGKHRCTIINWHNNDPEFLEIVLTGCVIKKAENLLKYST